MVLGQEHLFEEKFTEMNLRHRIWNKESIVSIQLRSELYPNEYDDSIVSGAVEVVFDCLNLKSLDELGKKHEKGDIGKITISIQKDGIWEHQIIEDYEICFKKRKGNKIDVEVYASLLEMRVTATIVSLYTTSTKNLEEEFNMKDFYKTFVYKKIGNSNITRYIVKKD